MTSTALAAIRSTRRAGLRFGPWLFGARIDLGLFLGSATFALGLVAIGHATGLSYGALPEWTWLAFVLAVDVAHVYSTLFRTYLDGEELRRHPLRYAALPLAAWACGVLLYLESPLTFWRALAYVAVFHFVRQQTGWVALYRARAGRNTLTDKLIDDAAVYAATLYPLLVWHSSPADRNFAWFMHGDFVDLSAASSTLVSVSRFGWVAALLAFALRQAWLVVTSASLELGKSIVVATTALVWWLGIVATNSDFDFTVTNVLLHGVPYLGLLWMYARARRREAPERLGSQIAGAGVGAFATLLLLLAFIEELGWDRLVWHDRPWLFGDGALLGDGALAIIVPLLAVPQATHYLLDGLLWRRADTRARPAQRAALGL
jgi:hypothetical protein